MNKKTTQKRKKKAPEVSEKTKISKKNSSKPSSSQGEPLKEEGLREGVREKELRQIRLAKLKKLQEKGIPLYPDRYSRSHSLLEASQLDEGTEVRVAGRITRRSKMGGMIFGDLRDIKGRLQFALSKDGIGQEAFETFQELIDIGDFIGCEGVLFRTKRGELTVEVKKYQFLGKALRPLPEKWKGVQDRELCYRQRYLDLIMNSSTRERFLVRSKVIRTIRRFLDELHFEEVETPVLCSKPSGALATPFQTHHNALDMDAYLRIAPETYLKRLIVGGYDRIYEFARCFRNEGMDPTHLQDFTMLEYYCAYWNYQDNMDFTEKLMVHLLQELAPDLAKVRWLNQIEELKSRGKGKEALKLFKQGFEVKDPLKIYLGDEEIDFTPPWPRISLRDLILQDTGIDVYQFSTAEALRKEIQKKKILIEDMEKMGKGKLVDQLYKKTSRPKLKNPTFIISHPIELSPLARKNDENPQIVDRFQLLVGGAEIVNAYSELVDPMDQRKRLEEQAKLNQKGDEEAMVMDEDYLLAMEHGMPPISGWGMGIDRVVALFTGQENLRDVIFFPLMKPLA